DLGGFAWSVGRVDDSALAPVVLLPAFLQAGVGAYGIDRGHRRPVRRFVDQPHEARPEDQGHGRHHPRPRRHPRPHRQHDLRGPAVLPHGALVPQYLLTPKSIRNLPAPSPLRGGLGRGPGSTLMRCPHPSLILPVEGREPEKPTISIHARRTLAIR